MWLSEAAVQFTCEPLKRYFRMYRGKLLFQTGEYLQKNWVGRQHFSKCAALEQPQTEWVLGMEEGKLQDPFNVVLWLANPQILL